MTFIIMPECCYAECRYDECHSYALYAECRNAECRYAECRYIECRGAVWLTYNIVVPITTVKMFFVPVLGPLSGVVV